MKKIITLQSITSIDAPIIGLSWYLYFSNLYGIKPNIIYSLIIFSSIWLGYMSDRLFDAKNLKSISNLSARHAFALKHSSSIWIIWAATLISTVVLCLFFLNKEKIIACILLSLIVLIYHLLCQCLLKQTFIKELAVPIIFALAIHLFLEYKTNISDFFNFSLICLMNCIFLSKMDQQSDTKMGFTNITNAFRPQIFSYFFLFAFIYFILTQSLLINPYTILALIILLLDKISFHFSREGIRFLIETMFYLVPLYFILCD